MCTGTILSPVVLQRGRDSGHAAAVRGALHDALLRACAANALSADGLVYDPEQNALLGPIISRMEVGI
jgi:hypothetical protein